jgi:hypothetical protein
MGLPTQQLQYPLPGDSKAGRPWAAYPATAVSPTRRLQGWPAMGCLPSNCSIPYPATPRLAGHGLPTQQHGSPPRPSGERPLPGNCCIPYPATQRLAGHGAHGSPPRPRERRPPSNDKSKAS